MTSCPTVTDRRETLDARLSRAIDQHGFARGNDDPLRDFMATYFDKDDWNTRAQVIDFIERIIRKESR